MDDADLDDTDLDIVVEVIRAALDRGDGLNPTDQVLYLTHGRPIVAMLDDLEPLDIEALRGHLRALGDGPDLVGAILGPDDETATAAIERARALRLGRVWGKPHPASDD
jgi:hypothetical protein